MKKLCLTLMSLCAIGTPILLLNGTEAIEVRAEEVSTTASIETAGNSEENPWDSFVANYLTADKVAMYMSWVAYIGTIIGLAANIAKLRKANNLTLKNVSEEVIGKLKEVVGAEVTEEVERFLPAIVSTQEKTNEILKIFSKILALTQENTPEARVAILQLIEQLGIVGKEITDSVKDAIEEEEKAIEEKKVEVEKKLDEIIEEYDGTAI